MRLPLVWAASWDHVDVKGLCRARSAPHWLKHFGELAVPLTGQTQASQQAARSQLSVLLQSTLLASQSALRWGGVAAASCCLHPVCACAGCSRFGSC